MQYPRAMFDQVTLRAKKRFEGYNSVLKHFEKEQFPHFVILSGLKKAELVLKEYEKKFYKQ